MISEYQHLDEWASQNSDFIGPPIQLFLELTSACNLRCKHCYIRAGEGRVQRIEQSVLHALLQEFSEIGGNYIAFSGGEPTLYPGWRRAIKYARFLGLETTLITNATNLSLSDIEFLFEFDVHVAISLDGASAAIHDDIRGVGTFERTVAVVQRFGELGLGGNLTLCFTPMASNYTELPAVVALANRIGAGRVYLSLLENRGRATFDFDQYGLTQKGKQQLIYSIYSLQARNPHLHIQCTNLRYFTERLHGIEIDGDDLDRTIRVTATGDIFLTAYLDAEPFHLGKYPKTELSEMWYSPKVLEAFRAATARRFSLRECMNCECWETCRGGSAALAWADDLAFSTVDGYCEAKRAVFREIAGRQRQWTTIG